MAISELSDLLVVNAIPAHIWRAAPDGAIQFVNQQWMDYTGLSQEQSQGWGWASANVIHPDDLPGLLDTWQRVLAAGQPDEAEARVRRLDGEFRWYLIRAVPVRNEAGDLIGWYGTNTDIEDRKRAEALLASENQLLEMLAQGHPLGAILNGLCRTVEERFSKWSVSIMLLNPDDNRLWYGATGSLPDAYTKALDGLEVGASHGSCGAAAYRNEPVIVADVATDPLWGQYRDVALSFGLRACWSTPINAADGQVLATFAVLSRETGSPTPEHQRIISEVTHLASVAIAHAQRATALRRSEAYLAEAQTLSRTGSFGWQVASGTLFWSRETFTILGFQPDTKPSLDLVFSRVHPQDLSYVQQVIANASREGRDLDFEHRLLRVDGSVQHLHVRARAVTNESGALEYMGAVSDVTATKVAQEQIRRNEQELRQVIDAIPQLIVAMDPVGRILYANESVLQSTGLSLSEVMDDGFRAWLFHPDDLEKLRNDREQRMQRGLPFELEMRARLKDRQYRWYLVQYKPLVDATGRLVRWYATGTDIDERRRAEERTRNENAALREEISRASMFEEIVGTSEAVRAVLRQVSQVAPTDSTVLITGETGTGKELIARAIHHESARAARAFVTVNCAAIPASLIASELFGHERGAFTGALQRRQGKFELADGGTIFLDEVGELPADTQMALLRVLQEREFERVGSSRPQKVDVRVIAATNRDLQTAVDERNFRSDLFYRLNVFPIDVPPLRDRPTDIPLLVEYFVHRFAKRAGKKITGVSAATIDVLREYSWPGNIRELQNVIERAVIVADTETLTVDQRWLLKRPAAHISPKAPLDDELQAHQRARVEAALAESKGRVSGPDGAAAKLGMPRSTLESKIRALKLDKHRFRSS